MRISDWSSDVCSSDLRRRGRLGPDRRPRLAALLCQLGGGLDGRFVRRGAATELVERGDPRPDRKSVVSGKSVSVRVDLGGRRIIKKKKTRENTHRKKIEQKKASNITRTTRQRQ